MKILKKILSLSIFETTFGLLSIAAFLICSLSGILLAIPYDVNAPYESISYFMIFNPAAVFARNLHYWSAQLTLIFTILHIWDHFKQNSEKKVKKPIWLRLTLSILVLFFVMLSGFILKADPDSLQARRILTTLISSVPLIGKSFSFLLLGAENHFDLIYVHHIATATIILFIIIFEHSKTIWGQAKPFILMALIVGFLSFFFQAPLHNNISSVIKGPWYFTGLQEILHWLNRPAWSLIIILIILLIIYLLPFLDHIRAKFAKRTIYLIFIFYLIISIFSFYFRGENWKLIFPWQNNYSYQVYFPKAEPFNSKQPGFTNNSKPVAGRYESCLSCHEGMKGLSPSHSPEAIGCVSCHSGNPFTSSKKSAHKGMILIPGNLNSAKQSCGTNSCHPEISERILTSMMTTISGIISVDRFAFGESDNPSVLSHISRIRHSKTDIHLRNLCTQCHLGNQKTEYGAIDKNNTGGGCLACHLSYSTDNKKELAQISKGKKIISRSKIKMHPDLTLKVNNESCFGCHSRSGRISLSYEGWYETDLKPEQVKDQKGFQILSDKRVLAYAGEDVHHKAGLDCIDCHNSYELMGDGLMHSHKEDQVQTACSDCHFTQAKTISSNEIDRESSLIAALRNYKHTKYLVYNKSGKPILNGILNENDSAWLYGKNSGKKFYLKPPASSCQNNAHQNLSCEACHTPWVARCIGCHNSFDKNLKGNDQLKGGFTKGKWTEFAGELTHGSPTLGVSIKDGKKKVITMMPGMIMSIQNNPLLSPEKYLFRRLYAPSSPHNTNKPKLNCKECHLSPVILGYGSGKLLYNPFNPEKPFSFIPEYTLNRFDQLPEDAWIGFLKEGNPPFATRNTIRPFNISEQKKILTIGICLKCHDENSTVMKQSLINFENIKTKMTPKCRSYF